MEKNIKYIAILIGAYIVYKFVSSFTKSLDTLTKDSAEYLAKKSAGYSDDQIVLAKQAAKDLYQAFNKTTQVPLPFGFVLPFSSEDEDLIVDILNQFTDAKIIRLVSEDFKAIHPKQKSLKLMVDEYLSKADKNKLKEVVKSNLI